MYENVFKRNNSRQFTTDSWSGQDRLRWPTPNLYTKKVKAVLLSDIRSIFFLNLPDKLIKNCCSVSSLRMFDHLQLIDYRNHYYLYISVYKFTFNNFIMYEGCSENFGTSAVTLLFILIFQ